MPINLFAFCCFIALSAVSVVDVAGLPASTLVKRSPQMPAPPPMPEGLPMPPMPVAERFVRQAPPSSPSPAAAALVRTARQAPPPPPPPPEMPSGLVAAWDVRFFFLANRVLRFR